MGLGHCIHGVFHVVFGYVFHVCDCGIVCYILISVQKVLFITLFIIGFECFLYTNHSN